MTEQLNKLNNPTTMFQMKKIFLLILAAAPGYLLAQQLPYYSQYMFTNYFINPAVAGSDDHYLASLSLRNQWTGLKGSPNTQTAGIYGPWGRNMGIGGLLFNHSTGPISRAGLQLSYSYHIDINADSRLGFGLAGMFYQHTIRKSELIADIADDPALVGEKERTIAPDAAFGTYYYTKKYYVGFSIPQLFQNRLNYNSFNKSTKENKLVRHYFLNGGYKFEINDQFDLEPSLLLKAVVNAPFQFDINARATYKDFVWLGTSYRNKESVVMMLGATKNNFVVGYSYDLTLSNIRKHSSGSHEIFLGLKINTVKATSSFQ